MITNAQHLEVLIRTEKTPAYKNLLLELYDYVNTLSDDEYRSLVIGIRNGEVTDLYPISNRIQNIH